MGRLADIFKSIGSEASEGSDAPEKAPETFVGDDEVRSVVESALAHARGFSSKVVVPWVVGTCFALSVVTGAFAGGAPSATPEPPEPSAPVAAAAVEPEPEPEPQASAVSVSVAVPPEWLADGSGPNEVAVSVAGTTDDGGAVSKDLSVAPGSASSLELEPGSYVATAQTAEVTVADTVFSSAPVTFLVDGSGRAVSASVTFAVDAEKTQALAAEKAEAERLAAEKAAAEKAAAEKAEAERVAAEQAAAEQAAAEQARQAQEAAEAEKNAQTVYITDTGEKYHNAGCRHLRKSKHPISLSDAIARGYEPCKNCH